MSLAFLIKAYSSQDCRRIRILSIQGRDDVVKGARLRAGKPYLERPVQHLYTIELSYDRPVEERGVTLSAQALELQLRRTAAVANQRIAAIHAFNKSGRHLEFSINNVIRGKIIHVAKMATKDESSVDVDFAVCSYKKECFYFISRGIFSLYNVFMGMLS